MDISERRTWVRKQLGNRPVPDPVWQFLVDRRFVAEEMEDHEEKALLATTRQLLALYRGENRAPRKPGKLRDFLGEDVLSPYVEKRVRATLLGEMQEDNTPVAIVGSIEDGYIWVSAEPWVSAKDFQRYYRALQDLVFDGRRNRPMKASTLRLYRWVTRRRQGEKKNEPWESTRKGWNREHERKYEEISNFHRDYHRAKKQIEEVERAARDLDFRY